MGASAATPGLDQISSCHHPASRFDPGLKALGLPPITGITEHLHQRGGQPAPRSFRRGITSPAPQQEAGRADPPAGRDDDARGDGVLPFRARSVIQTEATEDRSRADSPLIDPKRIRAGGRSHEDYRPTPTATSAAAMGCRIEAGRDGLRWTGRGRGDEVQGLLRRPGSGAGRQRRGDQEGLSAAGPALPPRCGQGGRIRGALQGDQRGLSDPLRSGQTQGVRRTRPAPPGRGVPPPARVGNALLAGRRPAGGGPGRSVRADGLRRPRPGGWGMAAPARWMSPSAARIWRWPRS